MKNILITQRLVKCEDYPEVRDALDVRWADLCKALSYLPIPLPSHYNFKQYLKSIKIDGIILTGGNGLASLSDSEFSRERDSLEKQIIKFAIQERIPILGICRGMQIIADYFHSNFKKVDGHIGVRHRLHICDDTKFKRRLERLNYVNSYHTYGIRDVSRGLIISAKSQDGIIEAIEHKKYRIFGQMWHSEREKPFSKSELGIIEEFFRE